MDSIIKAFIIYDAIAFAIVVALFLYYVYNEYYTKDKEED